MTWSGIGSAIGKYLYRYKPIKFKKVSKLKYLPLPPRKMSQYPSYSKRLSRSLNYNTSRMQRNAAALRTNQIRVRRMVAQRKIFQRKAAVAAAKQRAVIQRLRLVEAKKLEISNVGKSIKSRLWDKATFGQSRRERASREMAATFYDKNQQDWGDAILRRTRVYEKRGAKLQDWVMHAQNSKDPKEYERRRKIALKWLTREYAAIGKGGSEIKDFTKTQKQLAAYSEKPLTGKLAGLARINKNLISKVAGTSFNALTWTTSQPQRGLNTIKNLVKPDNQRLYYGGEEKKGSIKGGGWLASLKRSYNESRNQRIVGTSKADEQRRLKDAYEGKKIPIKGKPGQFITVKGDKVDRFRIKYGDDIMDMLLDPVNLLPAGWGGKTLKAGGKFARRSEKVRNFATALTRSRDWLKSSKFGKVAKKLGAEYLPRSERARQAVSALNDELGSTVDKFRASKGRLYRNFAREKGRVAGAQSKFLAKQLGERERLINRSGVYRRQAEKLSQSFVKRLDDFSDREVRALTVYARNGKWGTGARVGINKFRRQDLTNFLSDYQLRAKAIADADRLTKAGRARNYLPEFSGRGYDPTARRKLFGSKYFGQSRQQLQESIIMREFSSSFDETNSFAKQLAATEKSILRNARRSKRSLTEFEQQQLKILDKRKAALGKLGDTYNQRFGDIRGAMEKARMDAKPALSFTRRGGFKTNLSKQGVKNSLADAFHAPMKIWKKSVLKYNPAWYINNAAWNVPASVSASGKGVFNEYRKLLTSAKYRNTIRKNLPEGVASKISQEIGKGGLATKIEDTSRIATFLALKKQGKSDDEALKILNRWLFDYGTKNWERPIKGVLPFWQWQKNLIKLGAEMPFTNPRSAKVYSETYKKFYQRPYDLLPSEVKEYRDPETGKMQRYDPKKFYKGKAKIGDKWYGLPFFAVNPETMLQFGVNPYITAATDFLTSSDRLEKPNTDRPGWTILGERFPQANLIRNYLKRGKKNNSLYFSASGHSKGRQGYDETKPNYDATLDERIAFRNSGKSFLGIPRGVGFDAAEFDRTKRITAFNTEFFAIDWEKAEAANYKKAQKAKQLLAQKYGFDLQKDIYDGYWSKYDTETTKNTKRLKRQAAKFNSPDTGYWRDYFRLPKGNLKSPSKRRPFLINKFAEWDRDHTFAKNVYFKLPGEGKINPADLRSQEAGSQARRAAGKAKYQRYLEYQKAKKTGDWSFFGNRKLKPTKRMQEYAKAKRTGDWSFFGKRTLPPTERMRQYAIAKRTGNWSYFDKNPSDSTPKSSPYRYKGKFFKSAATMEKFKTGDLWRSYFKLDTIEDKQKFLDKHPELRTFDEPTTQAEWDALRIKLRKERMRKSRTIKGFTAKQQRLKRELLRTAPMARRRTFAVRYK